MYDDDSTDAEGSLADKIDDGDIHVMATGLYHQVLMLEVNNNGVNS